MIALGLLFTFNLLITGGTILGIHAGFARNLDLPGAGIIPWLPGILAAAYALSVFGLRRVKNPNKRWAGFILVTFLAHGGIISPLEFFHIFTVPIPLSALPSKDSLDKFGAAYPVKRAVSPWGKGYVLRVRREDYSETMPQFARDLVTRQREQTGT